jgi:hypothetical protein
MSVMAKRRQSEPADGNSGRIRVGENLNVWVREEIVEALRAYLASVRPRTTKTASVEVALEEFLRARGFWPPGVGQTK